MPRITRRIEFDSGHRVLGHEGKCKHLHGHRYVAEVTIDAPELDGLGRVIDFTIVKAIIGGWVNMHWDHNLLLHPQDPLISVVQQLNATCPLNEIEEASGKSWDDAVYGGKPPYVMETGNPTAENIATELLNKSQQLLTAAGADSLTVCQVRIYETPNCWADAFGEIKWNPPVEKVKTRRTMYDTFKSKEE